MKNAVFALLSVFCLLLSGCAGKGSPPETGAPAADIPVVSPAPTETAPAPTAASQTAETAPAPTAGAPADLSGTYTYHSGDGIWTLTLRDSGPYTLQKEGEAPHTGESWAANADGTVSCGPTDLWTEAFADSNGCSCWTLYPDGSCHPVLPG